MSETKQLQLDINSSQQSTSELKKGWYLVFICVFCNIEYFGFMLCKPNVRTHSSLKKSHNPTSFYRKKRYLWIDYNFLLIREQSLRINDSHCAFPILTDSSSDSTNLPEKKIPQNDNQKNTINDVSKDTSQEGRLSVTESSSSSSSVTVSIITPSANNNDESKKLDSSQSLENKTTTNAQHKGSPPSQRRSRKLTRTKSFTAAENLLKDIKLHKIEYNDKKEKVSNEDSKPPREENLHTVNINQNKENDVQKETTASGKTTAELATTTITSTSTFTSTSDSSHKKSAETSPRRTQKPLLQKAERKIPLISGDTRTSPRSHTTQSSLDTSLPPQSTYSLFFVLRIYSALHSVCCMCTFSYCDVIFFRQYHLS